MIHQPLFRFVVTLAVLAVAQNGKAEPLQGRLTLSGDQHIPMRIQAVQDGIWNITSPLFYGDANVSESAVHAIQFDKLVKVETDDMFRFELRSGEVLVGRLVSLDNQSCSIDHFDLGVVKVDSRQLVHATRVKQNQKVLTAADLPVPNCKAIASGSGTMVLSNGQRLASPFDISEGSAMSVLFRTRTDTDFRILLKAAGKTVVSVQVSADGVMAESADSLEFADIEMQPGIEQLTFVVANQRLSNRNRLGVEVLSLPCKCDAAPSVDIVNGSSRLDIIQTRLETVGEPVEMVQSQTGNILVVNKNGKSYACENVTVDDGKVIFAEENFSIDGLQSVHFPKRTFSDKHLGPACTLWADGSRMAVSRLESRDSKLFISSERILKKKLTEISSPQAIFFADAEFQRPAVGKHNLMLGSSQYTGTFEWGDAKGPLRWQFDGFEKPVALSMNRKISLSEFGARRPIDLTGLDRLILINGTILPCRILSIDQNGVRIDSSYCETTVIPVDQFRACFFASHFDSDNATSNSAKSNSAKSITTESIQRMLTIPRFSRGLEPEHVLMATTGDILRGTLESLGEKVVVFDSRAEPLRIDRSRISGIVRLNGNENGSREPRGSGPVDSIAINYGNDFVVVGELMRSGTELQIDVPGCGRCEVPKQGVKSLQVNADRTAMSPLYRYANLNPNASMDPRWSEAPAANIDAAKTKGKPAPDFALTTLDGDMFRLSDHLGKVVVLDFWASWCEPCVMGMPGYLKGIQEFSEGEVVFAAVNLGETGSTVEAFQKKMQWDTKLLLDTQGQVAKQYNVSAIPHLVVIDPQGTVVEVSTGYHPDSASKLGQQIQKLLSDATK